MLAGLAAGLAVAAGGVGLAAAQSGGEASGPAGPEKVLADVAERLGVSEQALEDAFRAEGLERLDAAVAAGRISEERAAELRARIESGLPPMGRHHRPLAPFVETAAEYVGLTARELFDELRSGKSLAQVAEEHGKTADGLEQALLDKAKDRIHEIVTRTGPPMPGEPDAPGAS